MRPAPWHHLDQWRVASSPRGADYGAFFVPHLPTNVTLRIIAVGGDPVLGVHWEHVSVSLERRCPNWHEMEFACRLFWHEEECVMQLHPPRSEWVNHHPFCLHMWKPLGVQIPRPPMHLVGPPVHVP